MQKPCTLCVGCGRCETYSRDIEVLTEGRLPKGKAAFPCDVFEKVYEKEDALVCVDIGTTTVAMVLRRLTDGEMLDSFEALNPQRAYGSDVLSRMEKEDAHLQMKAEIEAVICKGIEKFRQKLVSADMGSEMAVEDAMFAPNIHLRGMVITGNTTMLYLLQGLSTKELSVAPFKANHLEQRWMKLGGLDTLLMSGISAFVGADVLAGMFALGMDEVVDKHGKDETIGCTTKSAMTVDSEEELSKTILLLDLGTNGEMVLASKDGFVATATPAAPAYEGGQTCLAGGVSGQVFEGNSKTEIYGSDYVSFLAYLLDHGYMDETGLLADPYFDEGIVVAGHKITQQDIRRLQLAKAATRAGLEILTKVSCPFVVYLAGGFGYYLDGLKAEKIGLLPSGFGAKTMAVGNLALEGAFQYGQCQFAKREVWSREGVGNITRERDLASTDAAIAAKRAYERVHAMKECTRVINLAMEPEFEQIYLESINFPSEF